MLEKRSAIMAGATVAVLAVVTVTVGVAREEAAPAHPASNHGIASEAPKVSVPPPLAVADPPSPDSARDAVPDVGEGRPAVCAGCLPERAVLDVVETYLGHLDPVYLHGEIWAQPLAEIAPSTPGLVGGLPKLPPGLLEAPEFNPMGKTVDTRDYPVESTWLVWLQTGWRSLKAVEQQIALGKLPEVARAWPPIKVETFVAVDSRTGDLRPDGIFVMTSMGIQPPYPAHHERSLELARERADYWLRQQRQTH